MQEEVDQKTIALAVNTTKMTGRVLAKAIQLYLQHHKDKSKSPKIYHGKQTIKQLMKQNAALSNIEITDKNIRSFESVAKKYNIDYALKKDTSQQPPRYLVFFKGRDVDVINMAFKEFTQKQLKHKDKPSLRKLLVKLKEQAQKLNQNRDREKHKDRDRDRGAEL